MTLKKWQRVKVAILLNWPADLKCQRDRAGQGRPVLEVWLKETFKRLLKETILTVWAGKMSCIKRTGRDEKIFNKCNRCGIGR